MIPNVGHVRVAIADDSNSNTPPYDVEWIVRNDARLSNMNDGGTTFIAHPLFEINSELKSIFEMCSLNPLPD